MKIPLSRALRLLVAVALLVITMPAVAGSTPSQVRSIIVFERGASRAGVIGRIEQLGGASVKRLPLVDGAVVSLPSHAAEKVVSRLEGVAHVEPDLVVHTLARRSSPQPQVLPWGVDRVDAETVWPTYTGDPIKIAVVDTGIDTKHGDLTGNLKGGTSTVAYTGSFTDDNGHGTHVAGTIAAVDNSIGVVGVAPLADLYAVKVLDRNGSGYLSDVIEGLQWSIAGDMDVVNMSLGTSSYSYAFDLAVQQTAEAGIVVVAAAGNSGSGQDTVNYPARFANVIAVSATDANDVIASFSSRGPSVDLAAPGVSIFSTYRRNSYSTLSGTSMAAPHVTGAVALVLSSPIGGDDLDEDGSWDPDEVENRLKRTAWDLGADGPDSSYGSGLVQADEAVVP